MSWISLVFRLIPKVVELIKIAENLFDDVPESGAQKKEYVKQAVKAIVEGITGITEKESILGKIYVSINAFIDIVCSIIFPSTKDKED